MHGVRGFKFYGQWNEAMGPLIKRYDFVLTVCRTCDLHYLFSLTLGSRGRRLEARSSYGGAGTLAQLSKAVKQMMTNYLPAQCCVDAFYLGTVEFSWDCSHGRTTARATAYQRLGHSSSFQSKTLTALCVRAQ